MTIEDLEALLKAWLPRLGLTHWQIELREGGCDNADSLMEVERQYSYERALIRFQPWLLTDDKPEDVIGFSLTDRRIEETLVHELLHCHTIGMVAVVTTDIDGQLHRDVETVMLATFRREEERLVDRLAVALVGSWPRESRRTNRRQHG